MSANIGGIEKSWFTLCDSALYAIRYQYLFFMPWSHTTVFENIANSMFVVQSINANSYVEIFFSGLTIY